MLSVAFYNADFRCGHAKFDRDQSDDPVIGEIVLRFLAHADFEAASGDLPNALFFAPVLTRTVMCIGRV
jgi:hypothetical protein